MKGRSNYRARSGRQAQRCSAKHLQPLLGPGGSGRGLIAAEEPHGLLGGLQTPRMVPGNAPSTPRSKGGAPKLDGEVERGEGGVCFFWGGAALKPRGLLPSCWRNEFT